MGVSKELSAEPQNRSTSLFIKSVMKRFPGKAVKAVEEAPKFVPFGGKGTRVDEKKIPAKDAVAGGGRVQESAHTARQGGSKRESGL